MILSSGLATELFIITTLIDVAQMKKPSTRPFGLEMWIRTTTERHAAILGFMTNSRMHAPTHHCNQAWWLWLGPAVWLVWT